MNKRININVFYKNDGNTILEILEQDFTSFLNDYVNNILHHR